MNTVSAARALDRYSGPREVDHVSGSAPVRFARDPAVSATGRYVAWNGALPGQVAGSFDVFLTDRVSGTTEHLTPGADNGSGAPSVSADGRLVAFDSHATNLVPDDTNGRGDVFVYDRQTRATTRITGAEGGASPALSGDGRYVAFTSGPELRLHDLQTGQTSTLASEGRSPSLSEDGRFVAFEQGSRAVRLDRQTGELLPVPAPDPAQRSLAPTLSADGRVVAFLAVPEVDPMSMAVARPPSHLYVRDLETGATRGVDRDHEDRPLEAVGGFSLSADGHAIAFEADPGFRRLVLQTDLETGKTRVVNARPDGSIDYGENLGPALSADGRTVVLATSCRNLGPQQVRVEGGLEPYRIFAIDSNNTQLGIERAAAELPQEPGTIEVGERTVDIGGIRLPRR